jgi:hypothetical protein
MLRAFDLSASVARYLSGRHGHPAQGQSQDLIVTTDDATSERHDMRFVEEEGTVGSSLGMREAIRPALLVLQRPSSQSH